MAKNVITIEDVEALKSLPGNVILRDSDGDVLVSELHETKGIVFRCPTAPALHGAPDAQVPIWTADQAADYLPMVVLNNDVLGEQVEQRSEDADSEDAASEFVFREDSVLSEEDQRTAHEGIIEVRNLGTEFSRRYADIMERVVHVEGFNGDYTEAFALSFEYYPENKLNEDVQAWATPIAPNLVEWAAESGDSEVRLVWVKDTSGIVERSDGKLTSCTFDEVSVHTPDTEDEATALKAELRRAEFANTSDTERAIAAAHSEHEAELDRLRKALEDAGLDFEALSANDGNAA